MERPLVSVICLCFNQARFVRETILSIVDQSYTNIEIIVVDDGSNDGSPDVIRQVIKEYPKIKSLFLAKNLGNCKAFNLGFKVSKGSFVFDLAADDVLMPDRIEKQIQFFQTLDAEYGVIFTDAVYIDEAGNFLRNHTDFLLKNRLLKVIPQGDIYAAIVSRYFICTPTMLAKREVFDVLNGYDESLSYEDFDFCVRASRIYKFAYLNEKLTKVRKVSNSMSTKLYGKGDQQLLSTYHVCRKIAHLNRTSEENDALVLRLKYEYRQAVFTENYEEANLFYDLLKEMKADTLPIKMLHLLNRLHLPLRALRNFYLRRRYNN